VHAYCHDPARPDAFLVQAIEVIAAAAQHFLGRVVLHDHHGNVVDLNRVGYRDDRAMRGRDVDGLVVENPVGDVLDAGFGQVIDGLEGFGQTGTLPPTGRLAGKAANRLDSVPDRRALVPDAVHRLLIPAMAHEL